MTDDKYMDAIRFLISEIENILVDGGDFDFKKADEILKPLGINIAEEYFQG